MVSQEVTVEIHASHAWGMQPGQIFTDARGRRFRAVGVAHSMGPGTNKSTVQAIEIPLPGLIYPHFTKELRTLVKLGVQRDILLVCIDNRTNGQNRICLGEINDIAHECRSDAEFVRQIGHKNPNVHPTVRIAQGRVMARRKGSSAVRRLADELARAGFTVLRIDKRRKRSRGLLVRVSGKQYRLMPLPMH